jgi:hypothetical protein
MLYDTKRTLRNDEVIFRGDTLVVGLNDHKGESRRRLLALLERCRQLPRLVAEARELGRPTTATATDFIPYTLASRPEHRTLLRKINLLLKRYRLRWSVQSVVFARGGEALSIQFPLVGAHESARRVDRSTEIFRVEQLLRLTELQAVDRVRECAVCQRWFMARRRNQSFCQVGCRRRNDRRQQNKQACALYQKSYRRKDKINLLKSRMRRARPSERQELRARIARAEKEIRELVEQRRKLLYADKLA